MSTELKNTVFLPRTTFPMKGNLAAREPEILALWAQLDIAHLQKTHRARAKRFVLHDGPPYANGQIHMGHAVNKIYKDLVNRSQYMMGAHIDFLPGWDCHGLPIEAKVEEAFRAKGQARRDVDPLTFRAACRAFADEWIGVQRDAFQKLGLLGRWDTPYTTMSPYAESQIVDTFLDICMRGHVYRGTKPVLWSVVEETALAEAEVTYQDITSPAIDVRFPLAATAIPELQHHRKVSALIWTTTPWSLPGNRAIAYSPLLTYVALQVVSTSADSAACPDEVVIMAESLVEAVCARAGITHYTIIASFEGTALDGTTAHHPWHERGYTFCVPLLPGDHVTADTGTGLVHTAPTHGVEDFALGQAYGLEVPETLNGAGIFAHHCALVAGLHVYKVNPLILQNLREVGALFHETTLRHSYPHSWRSNTPLIYRTTPQWFLRLDGERPLRQAALKEIERTTWLPAASQNRIHSMVSGRPDWCLSRQRVWGTPLTLLVHRDTGEILKNILVNERILKAIQKTNTDVWWTLTVDELLKGTGLNPDHFEKVHDILDVWFDAGVTHTFVMAAPEDAPGLHTTRADLYLEGSDQHRGWFQASLLTACALGKSAPYKAVLTHGFVVDEAGKKMSKSQGNGLSPQEIVSQKGTDILRLWVASSDLKEDIRLGSAAFQHGEDLYRRFRNTFRYLLGGLADFDAQQTLPHDAMPPLECWIYHRLWTLSSRINALMEAYEFQAALQEIHHFCATDLSAFYFDVRKDVLYCNPPQSEERRAVQTAMRDILHALCLWLAPILVFTAEEVWQTLRSDLPKAFPDLLPSVHVAAFPTFSAQCQAHERAEQIDHLRTLRRVITGALERARADKQIGSSLQAAPAVYLETPLSIPDQELLLICGITSQMTFHTGPAPKEAFTLDDVPHVGVVVHKAQGHKCGRCWKVLVEVQAPDGLCSRCQDATTP